MAVRCRAAGRGLRVAAAGLLAGGLLPGWAAAQHGVATTPPGGYPNGAFEPILQLPRPTDPEYPAANQCPYPRVSGLYAFTDPQDPHDPNDDREYLVAGRSDGIFLVDATADRRELASTVAPVIPATFHYEWIAETPLSLAGSPEENFLNGVPTGPSYCPQPVRFTTAEATNREVVAYHDRQKDNFYLYCTNNLRDGIWVIQLARDETTPERVLRVASAQWRRPFGQPGHTIAVDADRGFLFVATLAAMHVLSIAAPAGSPEVPQYLFACYQRPGFNEIGSGPHDMIVLDDKLYVSCWMAGAVDVFDMRQLDPLDAARWRRVRRVEAPPIANDPLNPPFVRTLHSVWVDNARPRPLLYMLEETAVTNLDVADITGINYENSPPQPDVFVPVSRQQIPQLAGRIPNPNNAPTATVHHLRAVGETGFLAHYTDGLDLVDLRDPTSMQVLASFDTTALTQSAPAPWFLIDNFLGVWDVAPHQDSGLVFASAGREGAFVFRVNQGHLNRYWNTSPLPPNRSQPRTVWPRIVAPYGPPRAGQPFFVRDGNRARYKSPGEVRWSLYLSASPPVAPYVDRRRGIDLNVDPAASIVFRNLPGQDVFGFLALPTAPGQKWYVQLVVEVPDRTGAGDRTIHAASRGAWFGVAQ